MCEGKGQCNSEKQEVQAKLLLVGKVLPGMLLKHILRTPYALSHSLCQQSRREELFPRCAVSQAHGYVCTGATEAPRAVPAVGIKQEQTPHTANPTESPLTEGLKAEVSDSVRKAEAHISALSTLSGTARNPPVQPSLQTGLLALDKVQQTARRKQSKPKKPQDVTNTISQLKAELGRCCHRPLSQSVIALPPPLQRPCKQFPKSDRNCMSCLL